MTGSPFTVMVALASVMVEVKVIELILLGTVAE